MEIRQYFFLVKKWIWLLALGVVIGGGVAYFVSSLQPTVYQTRTKLMVMSSPEERASNYYYSYNENQLAQSYSQMLATEQVIDTLSERLGFQVGSGQINVRPEPDSSIIDVTVRDMNPEQAALIANSLIDVFVEYNDSLQNSRFASSEQSLQAQIDQVEDQLTTLRTEMSQISEETLLTQKQEVEARIAELESELKPLKDEIEILEPTVTPPATPTTATTYIDGRLVLLTPIPQPTLTGEEVVFLREQKNILEEKQYQYDQLQSELGLYQQVYLNLSVYGESNLNSNQISQQNQLQGTLALYQQIYSNLLSSYENIRLARLRSTPNIVQIERAFVPGAPIQPQPVRNAALGAAAGLLILGAVVVLIEYLDDTLKTPEDVTRTLNLPVIGLIGEMENFDGNGNNENVYVVDNPRSPISEAFRTLRSNLEFASVDKPIKTLLIASASPSEGKTTVAVNLAAVMAQGEKNVALVDADLRRPSVHRFLHIPNRDGLSMAFRNPERSPTSLATTWGDPPISVITSGALPPNPAELLASDKMQHIMEDLKNNYDTVIFDGPPFIVADPAVLSAMVDGVILIIEPGKSKIDSARAMFEQLQRSGARVIGVVMNPISRKRTAYYSGKYRYYSDYYNSRGYGYYTSGDGSRKKAKGRWPTKPKLPGSQTQESNPQ